MGEADPSPGPGGPPLSEPGRTLQSPAVPSGPQKPAVGLRFCGFRVHHTMIFNVRVAGTPPPLARPGRHRDGAGPAEPGTHGIHSGLKLPGPGTSGRGTGGITSHRRRS